MADAAYEPPSLTEEQKKTMMVGQCNYLTLMMVSLAATICGSNATWFCNFFDRSPTFVEGFNIAEECAAQNFTGYQEEFCNSLLEQHGVGFYNWYATFPVDQQACVSYTLWVPNRGWITPSFDSAFEAARVFSVMANFFGLFGWISVIFASCCPVSQDRIKGLSCYFLLAAICQSFTFLLKSSDICDVGFAQQYIPNWNNDNVESIDCSLSDGGKQSVAAAVLYFVSALLAPVSIAPQPIGYRGRDQGDPNFSHPANNAAAAAAPDEQA